MAQANEVDIVTINTVITKNAQGNVTKIESTNAENGDKSIENFTYLTI